MQNLEYSAFGALKFQHLKCLLMGICSTLVLLSFILFLDYMRPWWFSLLKKSLEIIL